MYSFVTIRCHRHVCCRPIVDWLSYLVRFGMAKRTGANNYLFLRMSGVGLLGCAKLTA